MCGMARANSFIDPHMKMLEDDLSDPIVMGFNFVPNASGGGVFGFYNNTAETITEMTIETTIVSGLTATQLYNVFQCNMGSANHFFLFCRVDYTPLSGQLTIAFWGTNSPTPTSHPGILPLPSECTPTTIGEPCTGSHFAISLSDGPSLTDDSGGWSTTSNPGLFLSGGPGFTVSELQYVNGATPQNIAEMFLNNPADAPVAPEPRMMGLVAGALGGLEWIRRRRRSRA
jgi:hypothetical protein